MTIKNIILFALLVTGYVSYGQEQNCLVKIEHYDLKKRMITAQNLKVWPDIYEMRAYKTFFSTDTIILYRTETTETTEEFTFSLKLSKTSKLNKHIELLSDSCIRKFTDIFYPDSSYTITQDSLFVNCNGKPYQRYKLSSLKRELR